MVTNYDNFRKASGSIKFKIVLLVTSLCLFLSVAIAFVVYFQISKSLPVMVLQNSEVTANICFDYLEKSYEGYWQQKNGKLYKGEMEINSDSNSILDRFTSKDISGSFASTIFSNDIRIATTIVDKEGKRILGTKASSIVAEKVINKKEVYVSTVDIAGCKYYSTYIPIKDKKDNVLGIFFFGIMDDDVKSIEFSIIKDVLTVLIIAFILAFAIGLIFSLKIVKPINDINKVLSLMSKGQGDLTIRIDFKGSGEIKELSDNINSFMSMLNGMISNIREVSNNSKRFSEELSVGSQESSAAIREMSANVVSIDSTSLKLNNIITKEVKPAVYDISDYLEKVKNQNNNQAASVN